MRLVITKGLWTLALLLAAYGCGQDTSQTPVRTVIGLPTPTQTATPTVVPSTMPTSPPMPTPTRTAISPVVPNPIPASTPVPTSTLARRYSKTPAPIVFHALPDIFSGGSGGEAASGGDVDASSVEEVLEQGLRLAGASPVHVGFRGTAADDSVALRVAGYRANAGAARSGDTLLARPGR